MTRWFWLSFADPDLPVEEQFLGVVVVGVNENSIAFFDSFDPSDRIELLRERGQDEDIPFYVAVQAATLAGCNPGGEVRGWEITDKIGEVPERLRNRLVRKDELVEAYGPDL